MLIASLAALGQERDAELWTGLEVSKDLNKKISASLEEQVRLSDNMSTIKTAFAELGLAYRANEYVRLKLNYRFIQRLDPEIMYSFRHRYNADLTFRYKQKPLVVQFRTRYQVEYRDLYADENRFNPERRFRNKLTLSFDLDKDIEPFVGSELFYSFNEGQWNNFRLTSGASYRIRKGHELQVSYIFEQEMNVVNPLQGHIISLGYSVDF